MTAEAICDPGYIPPDVANAAPKTAPAYFPRASRTERIGGKSCAAVRDGRGPSRRRSNAHQPGDAQIVTMKARRRGETSRLQPRSRARVGAPPPACVSFTRALRFDASGGETVGR